VTVIPEPAWAPRFWAKIDQSGGPDACWTWIAAKSEFGYGFFTPPGGKPNSLAHRVMWELKNGPIPAGLKCLHTCGTGHLGCVNPAHLYLGTQKDNHRDRSLAGRTRNGRGKGYREKLDVGDVLTIRKLAPTQSYRSLGRLFGVSPVTIARVVDRVSWRNV